MTFRRKAGAAGAPVKLIVLGLGNPGPEYRETRHNLGFMAVDEAARRLKTGFDKREGDAQVARAAHPGAPRGSASVLLAKPQTYMNLSGRSAAALLQKHGLEVGDLWVAYDELDLPFGKLRIRTGGGDGGHNGMGSLIDELGTQRFVRFRMGVGRPPEGDAVDHLLSRFSEEEWALVPKLVDLAATAVIDALREGIDVSMNRHNGKSV